MEKDSKNRKADLAAYSPLVRAGRALLEWIAHTLVVGGLLLGFKGIEELIHFLWSGNERLLFGVFPLRYIFDAADLAILIGFLTYGVYSVIKAYRGS